MLGESPEQAGVSPREEEKSGFASWPGPQVSHSSLWKAVSNSCKVGKSFVIFVVVTVTTRKLKNRHFTVLCAKTAQGQNDPALPCGHSRILPSWLWQKPGGSGPEVSRSGIP